jgi:feruloyl esterase
MSVEARSSGDVTAAHCRVSGTIGPETHFTVLLPKDWNQRFFMGGGGGFVGTVSNQAISSVNRGYATAGTDTGHSEALNYRAGWALNRLERQLNFGYLAIHQTSETAKAIIRAYYSSNPAYSYFLGCSNGGRQGMMEAQRYPQDFDGIVAGAPAFNFTNIAAAFVKNAQALFPAVDSAASPRVTVDNLKLLESAVLQACDALDGLQDGLITDPRQCRFRVADIKVCAGDLPQPDCLTRGQRAAIERVYAPTSDREGEIYAGQPFGGEAQRGGWQTWITGINEQVFSATDRQAPSLQWAFGTEFFKYFVFGDPSWNYSGYDLSRWRRDTRLAATFLNADNPDLSQFKSRRGKLILWHGWSDPALNPLETIRYYQQVQQHDEDITSFLHLYLMPGVLHCAGGAGPDRVDWMTIISEWVERGNAPERVIATKIASDGKPVLTRPLCPFPQRAAYSGSGSADEAVSFVCKEP